jgi:hypothetical protein
MAETKTRSGVSRSRPRSSNGSQRRTAAAEQTPPLQEAMSKAKVPAIAGGAVLAGLAGAVAIARNGRGDSLLSNFSRRRRSKATRKALGVTAKAFSDTAVQVGKAGYRLGELSAEIRRVREQASKQH